MADKVIQVKEVHELQASNGNPYLKVVDTSNHRYFIFDGHLFPAFKEGKTLTLVGDYKDKGGRKVFDVTGVATPSIEEAAIAEGAEVVKTEVKSKDDTIDHHVKFKGAVDLIAAGIIPIDGEIGKWVRQEIKKQMEKS